MNPEIGMARLHRLAPLAAAVLLSLPAGAVLTGGTAAQAAANVRYVSITGSNANACTLAEPCRTLQRGINKTPPGGEVRILDSGDYGDATVTKPLTISGNGNTVYLGSALIIDTPGAVVAMRGLTLNGRYAVAEGISIVKAAAAHIEGCVIHRFTQYGIHLTGGNNVSVIDSIARDNGLVGLFVSGGIATVDNSRFETNGNYGVLVSQLQGKAAVHRSTVSGNVVAGFSVQNGAFLVVASTMVVQNTIGISLLGGSQVIVESSVIRGNRNQGLWVTSGNAARVSNSAITGNDVGIRNEWTTLTRQNNTVAGNRINLSGIPLAPFGGI
jgi:nitrous oxidase accessory protein NosD